MTTIAEIRREQANHPRRKLLDTRAELLTKIHNHITSLFMHPNNPHPRMITFIVGKTTYKILNQPERLQQFRILVERCPGWNGKLKTPADAMRAEYKRSGCRGNPVRNSFHESVVETANAERKLEGELKNANWRMGQHLDREKRLAIEQRAAVNDWENTRREVAALTIKHKEAQLASAYARGECAEFESYLAGEKANHEPTK